MTSDHTDDIKSSDSPTWRRPYERIVRRMGIELTCAGVVIIAVMFFALHHTFLPSVGIIAGVCVVFLAFLLGPYVGFTLYFATTFVKGIPLPIIPFSLNQIAGVVFIISWLNYFWRGKTERIRSPLLPALSLMTLYFAINALTGESFEGGVSYFRFLFVYFVLCLFLSSMMMNKRAADTVLWIILILTFLSSLVGVAEIVLQRDVFGSSRGVWQGMFRINGLAPNAIYFGYNLLFAFPFGYYLFISHKERLSGWIALWLSLFIVFLSLFTFNRQTIIIIAFTFFLVALLFRDVYSRTLLIGLAIAGIIILPFVAGRLVSRLATLGDITRDFSYMQRRDSFLIACEMLKKKPLTGVGLGSYHKVWEEYYPENTQVAQYLPGAEKYPDLGYMQVLTEGGIIGFMLFIYALFTFLKYLITMRRDALHKGENDWAHFIGSIIVGFLIFILLTFTQDTFLYARVWFFYGIVLSLASPRLRESFRIGERTS